MGKKAENVANLIMSSVRGNHFVQDPSHMTIEAKTTGFLFWKKTEIRVAGRVDDEKEKEAIDKILETENQGFTIVSSLRVHRR